MQQTLRCFSKISYDKKSLQIWPQNFLGHFFYFFYHFFYSPASSLYSLAPPFPFLFFFLFLFCDPPVMTVEALEWNNEFYFFYSRTFASCRPLCLCLSVCLSLSLSLSLHHFLCYWASSRLDFLNPSYLQWKVLQKVLEIRVCWFVVVLVEDGDSVGWTQLLFECNCSLCSQKE
jgi:hypothetical protein